MNIWDDTAEWLSSSPDMPEPHGFQHAQDSGGQFARLLARESERIADIERAIEALDGTGQLGPCDAQIRFFAQHRMAFGFALCKLLREMPAPFDRRANLLRWLLVEKYTEARELCLVPPPIQLDA
jgi:hypothetical protein